MNVQWQALVLASAVRMQHPLSNTPAIITPPAVTPAAADEPGATPMADGLQPPNSVSASGAPFVQKKRAGLHRHLLENAYHGAQAAQLDLVLLPPTCTAASPVLHAHPSTKPELNCGTGVEDTQWGVQLLVQDVKALAALARKRCADEKAGVRKAAAQLLEGLLLLRASGAGSGPVVMPSPADVAVVQAAAADSLARPRACPHPLPLSARPPQFRSRALRSAGTARPCDSERRGP